MRHAPRTLEGIEVWDLVMRCASQLRVGGNSAVLGLDLAVCLEVASAIGLDLAVTAELLPACEAGLLEGLHNRTPEP